MTQADYDLLHLAFEAGTFVMTTLAVMLMIYTLPAA